VVLCALGNCISKMQFPVFLEELFGDATLFL
jgi:hypothetical protein